VDDGPILICYDGSDEARIAIAVAASLLVGRETVVLNVGAPPMVAETYAAVGPGPAELDRIVFDQALARAEAGAELARRAGFRAEARADLESPTWQGVVEIADEIGAAAIVLGSRGLTGVHQLLGESVSQDVAQHAGRPVLVVPSRR
jgi:nucleotide-binding universal stress UspA family protein